MNRRSTGPACDGTSTGQCALCGDEALPGLVISIDAAARSAEVEMAGATLTVALDLVDKVELGNTVLVHQGFAISRMEPA